MSQVHKTALKGQRILVTGASGFVGRHCCRILQDMGMVVLGTSRQQADCVSLDEWYQLDLSQDFDLSQVLSTVDYIFHLAGLAHQSQQLADKDYQLVNHQAVLRLAQQAEQADVKQMVFLSTVKAKCIDGISCADELAGTVPQDAYGLSKYEAEKSFIKLLTRSRMKGVIIRPSLIYGSEVKGNLASLIGAIKRHIVPPLPHSGLYRSMVSVQDVVAAMIFSLDNKAMWEQIFIVTDGQSYDARRLYDGIRHSLGRRSIKKSIPLSIFKYLASMGSWLEDITSLRLPFNHSVYHKLFGSECYDSNKIRALGFVPLATFENQIKDIAK